VICWFIRKKKKLLEMNPKFNIYWLMKKSFNTNGMKSALKNEILWIDILYTYSYHRLTTETDIFNINRGPIIVNNMNGFYRTERIIPIITKITQGPKQFKDPISIKGIFLQKKIIWGWSMVIQKLSSGNK